MLKKVLSFTLILLLETTQSNLIKYGDFQFYANLSYTTVTAPGNYKFTIQPSDINSWYDFAQGGVQFKQIFVGTTIGVDLSSNYPMTLCQDVILEAGSKYNLSYDMYSTEFYQNMYGNAYINSQLLSTLYIGNSSTFGHLVYSFISEKSFNSICFNQIHTPVTYTYLGGFIDNISLILVAAYINFGQIIADELQNTFSLQGNYTFSEELKNVILNKYDVFIQGESVDYLIQSSDAGYISIQIVVEQTIKFDSVKFVEKSDYIPQIPEVYISISSSTMKYFLYLDGNEVSLLKNARKLLIFITELNSKILSLSQTFFFTYLINMIIGSQFLSLLYVFTQIDTIPGFTNKIYHQMLSIVFFNEGLLQYWERLSHISVRIPQIQFEDHFDEKIQKDKNKEHWFGYYGFTSRFLKGDLSILLILLLSFIKLCCLKLFKNLLSKCFPFLSKTKFKISSLFLTEFCYMVPFILIPLLANTIESVDKIISKTYKIGCILFLFVCLICLFFQMFVRSLIWKKIRRGKEKTQQKIQKKPSLFIPKTNKKSIIANQINIKTKGKQVKNDKNKNSSKKPKIFVEQAFHMPMLFFNPALALLGDPKIFLIVNGLTVIIRFFNFTKQTDRKLGMIIDFLSGSVWVIHHCSFVVFLIYQNKNLDDNDIGMIINFGITAVLTIICIVLLQCLKILFNIMIFLRNSLRMLCKLLKQRRKRIQQQKRQKIEKGKKGKKDKTDKSVRLFIQVVKVNKNEKQDIKQTDQQPKAAIQQRSQKDRVRNQRQNYKDTKI